MTNKKIYNKLEDIYNLKEINAPQFNAPSDSLVSPASVTTNYTTHQPVDIKKDHIVKKRKLIIDDPITDNEKAVTEQEDEEEKEEVSPDEEEMQQEEIPEEEMPQDPDVDPEQAGAEAGAQAGAEAGDAAGEDAAVEMGGDDMGMDDTGGDMGMGDDQSMGMDPMGMGGEEVKSSSELGRIFELKKIYSRLTAIEAYLSDEYNKEMIEVRNFVSSAIELFEIISSNINSYKDKLDDIIVMFYKFLKEVYGTVRDFYKEQK